MVVAAGNRCLEVYLPSDESDKPLLPGVTHSCAHMQVRNFKLSSALKTSKVFASYKIEQQD